jgi:hypothetical protein
MRLVIPLAANAMAATPEEIRALLGEVEPSFIDRIIETGASLAEITEAIDDLEGQFTAPHVPSTVRVAEAREILGELIGNDAGPRSFPIRGEPVQRHV